MADELKCKGCDATEGIFRDGYCLNCLAAQLAEARVEAKKYEELSNKFWQVIEFAVTGKTDEITARRLMDGYLELVSPGVPASPGDTSPVTQHCPNCAKLAKRAERLEKALRLLDLVEWDEFADHDLSATAFRYVMLEVAGVPDDKWDDPAAAKAAYPDGVPGIGDVIKQALAGERGDPDAGDGKRPGPT